MSRTKFRYDINGLRALAAISVVLFHFKVPGFSGGFVGVDVFFVISGFLMTGIIVRGLEDKSGKGFKLFDFYMARARRIVPALFVLCATLLVIGWFYLAPDDYVKLAREADRALLFISNNYYYKKFGYFDASSHESMLLHTWTLSVEWQFYMVYPLILMLLSRLGIRWLPHAIAVMMLASFAVSVFKSGQDASYAFYLLPSRAWEMFIGGLAFYVSRSRYLEVNRKYLYYPGLLAIFLAIVFYDANTRWPGFPAVLPVLGTAFVIFANFDCFSHRNWVAQRLGDWSYSVYLWHWPLVVTLVLLDIQGFGIWSLGLIVLSVLLGWISYSVFENPIRKLLTGKTNWKVLLVILLAIAMVLIPAEKIRKAKGYLKRIPGEVNEILSAEFDRFSDMDKCHDKRAEGGPDCFYGKGEKPLAIVMGDSHAMSLMPLLADYYKEQEGRVLDWTGAGCPTLHNVRFTDGGTACMSLLEKKFVDLKSYHGIPVFLTNRYSASFHGGNEINSSTAPNLYFDKVHSGFSGEYVSEIYSAYKQTICKISEDNPVYMFRPVPELKLHVPKVMGRALLYRGERVRISISREEYEQRNMWANRLLDDVSENCGVKTIDVSPYFCDEQNCYGDLEGKPVYFDDDHLNAYGARLLRELLEENIESE